MKNLIFRKTAENAKCLSLMFGTVEIKHYYFGRCLQAKSLRILQLVHMISNLNISKAYILAISSTILNYLFGKRKKDLKSNVE